MPYKDKQKRLEHNRKYHKKWYKKNKDKVLADNLRRKERNRKYLRKIRDVPCKDCGMSFPYYCMDFDHRPGTKKVKVLSRMARYGMDKVKAEVEKCDIVCANCHRIRTHKRRQSPII